MFCFEIPGRPQGKSRPRVTKNGTFTPKKTKEYENLIKLCFKNKYKNVKVIAEKMPVAVFIIAYYKVPKGMTKKELALINEDKLLPTVKPDADNISKVILDSLNGIAYKDDNQVTDLIVRKKFALDGESECVKVFITSFEERPELFDRKNIMNYFDELER